MQTLRFIVWSLTSCVSNSIITWNFPKLSVTSLTVWNGSHFKSLCLFENLQFLLCSLPLNISEKSWGKAFNTTHTDTHTHTCACTHTLSHKTTNFMLIWAVVNVFILLSLYVWIMCDLTLLCVQLSKQNLKIKYEDPNVALIAISV